MEHVYLDFIAKNQTLVMHKMRVEIVGITVQMGRQIQSMSHQDTSPTIVP